MKPPIFIVGAPRSGTTLLRRLLNSHPNIGIPNESHFIVPFYRAYGDPASAGEARKLATRILRDHRVQRWETGLVPDDFSGCRRYRDLIRRLYGAWAEQHGKQRWGDKTPDYVTDISILLEIFPEARIIHIHRDGRDVALPVLRRNFGPCNVYAAARRWDSWVRRGRQQGECSPDGSHLEVCHETLLAKPRPAMTTVRRYLDEPFRDDVLAPTTRPDEGTRFYPPAYYSQIIPSNTSKWKTRMRVTDRRLFESVAGDLPRELGYETAAPEPAPARMRRWAWTVQDAALRLWQRLRNARAARRHWTDFRLFLAGMRSSKPF